MRLEALQTPSMMKLAVLVQSSTSITTLTKATQLNDLSDLHGRTNSVLKTSNLTLTTCNSHEPGFSHVFLLGRIIRRRAACHLSARARKSHQAVQTNWRHPKVLAT